mmetsp:Transcript_65904/g.132708  ORF Transcript_65904/g.132708 Transcript_65904/m.132708 type:complete len:228 (-) Transcript_65904:137-820(-)
MSTSLSVSTAREAAASAPLACRQGEGVSSSWRCAAFSCMSCPKHASKRVHSCRPPPWFENHFRSPYDRPSSMPPRNPAHAPELACSAAACVRATPLGGKATFVLASLSNAASPSRLCCENLPNNGSSEMARIRNMNAATLSTFWNMRCRHRKSAEGRKVDTSKACTAVSSQATSEYSFATGDKGGGSISRAGGGAAHTPGVVKRTLTPDETDATPVKLLGTTNALLK